MTQATLPLNGDVAELDLEAIKPGDMIRQRRGWRRVIAIHHGHDFNYVQTWTGSSWTDRVDYDRILGHRPAEAPPAFCPTCHGRGFTIPWGPVCVVCQGQGVIEEDGW